MNSSSAKGRWLRASVIAWSVIALVAGPTSIAAADHPSAACRQAFAAVESGHDPMSEYVRVLIYWHHHPDWGLGG
jgi:hypothetical protein